MLYEGYIWRKDEEALFYGHFYLPVINYMRKKEYRFKDVVGLVEPLLSTRKIEEIKKLKKQAKKQREEALRKKFNL